MPNIFQNHVFENPTRMLLKATGICVAHFSLANSIKKLIKYSGKSIDAIQNHSNVG